MILVRALISGMESFSREINFQSNFTDIVFQVKVLSRESGVVSKSIFESVFEFKKNPARPRFRWAIRITITLIFTKNYIKVTCSLWKTSVLVIDWPQICQVRKPRQRHLCFSFDTNFINQSFPVRSRLSNDRHAARLRGSLTISKCTRLRLLSKWMPPEVRIGRVLRVVEFLVNFHLRCWCSTVSAPAYGWMIILQTCF